MAKNVSKRASSVSLGHPSSAAGWFFSSASASGVSVTEESALECSAVWRAVTLLSGALASLPMHVYEDTASGKQKVDHPLSRVLNGSPSTDMSSYQYKEAMHIHLLLYGNCYSEIEINGAGIPIALWLIPPEVVTIKRDANGKLVYSVRGVDKTALIPASRMIHVSGPSHNGISGYQRVKIAAQSLGVTLAAEKYGAGFYNNALRPSGVLEHPGKIEDQALNNLKVSLREQTGSEHAAKVLVLEEGMKWTSISLQPNEAQFIETRRFQIEEVARFFSIRPQWLDATNTGGTPEHLAIDLIKYSLRPDMIRYEQEFSRKLFPDNKYSVEFNADAILRGDTKSRYEAHSIGLNSGFLTVNEVRKMEGLPLMPEKLPATEPKDSENIK